MKYCSHLLIVAVLAGLSALGTPAGAGVEVAGADPARISVTWVLDDLKLQAATAAGQPVTVVMLDGALPRQEAGSPELPTLATSLLIPGSGTPVLNIVSRTEHEVPCAPVLPSLGHVTRDTDPADLPRFFGPAYTADQVFPAAVAELGRPFLLGDHRGVSLRLNPVRWDAARGVLLVTDSITVEVTTTGRGGVNTLPAGIPASSAAFRALHRGVFANLPAVADGFAPDKYAAPIARGRMLVISHDSFVPALSPFLAWKAQRGIAAKVVPMSATDGTAAGVRRLIADEYLAEAGLTWVVLVGDREQIPTNTGSYDGSDADSPYAMIVGDDLYPEVFVSRISAGDSRAVETQLAKFIAYERNPAVGAAAAWYGRAAGIASDEGVPADYERAELLRTDLLASGFTAVDRIYQSMGAVTASITAAVNEGRSVINYLGHGSGLSWDSVPFRTTDVNALVNGNKLPWIIDVSCSNGEFARATCFAEAWLRAGTPTAPAGAVGMIAASSLAPWTPPTVMQAEIADLLAAGSQHNLGALYYSGLMRVLDEYDGVPVATQVIEQNIVFGDASLQVRTRVPGQFLAQVPAGVEVAAGELWLTVTGAVGALGGTVAVTAGEQLIGAADFATAGGVRVPLNASLAGLGAVTVTVTGDDMVPWQGTVAVTTGTTPVLETGLPAAPVLRGNYPNPFNPSTRIVFDLPAAGRATLDVFDVGGRLVRRLVEAELPGGRQEVLWEGRDDQGRDAPSGIYLYRLVTAEGALVGRMILAK